MPEDLDKFITWWVDYFACAIGKKVTWEWMRRTKNIENGAIGHAYQARGHVVFNPFIMEIYWQDGDRTEIRNIIAHELTHIRFPDEYHGENFRAGMKAWTGKVF